MELGVGGCAGNGGRKGVCRVAELKGDWLRYTPASEARPALAMGCHTSLAVRPALLQFRS